ncbi:MAG: hypothetical protein JWN49_700 [Parcubacteria group bacterium]|nr:hypothetical protein [Parcubacteria group bacterium]
MVSIKLIVVAVLATTSSAMARNNHATLKPAPITIAMATAGYVDVVHEGSGPPPTPEQLLEVQKLQQRVLESCRGAMSWSVFLDCVSHEASSIDFGPGMVAYTIPTKPPMPEDVE